MDDAPEPMFEANYALKGQRAHRYGFASFDGAGVLVVADETLEPLERVALDDVSAIRIGYPRMHKGRKLAGHVVLTRKDGSLLLVHQRAPAIRDWVQMTPEASRVRDQENMRRYRAFVRDLLAEADRRGIAVTAGYGKVNEPRSAGMTLVGVGVAMIVLLGLWQGALVPGLGGLVFVGIGAALLAFSRSRAAKPIGRDAAALEPFMPGVP